MFKIGDKVVSLLFGNGIVSDIDECSNFSIGVDFDSGYFESYSNDGHISSFSIRPDIYLVERNNND